MNISQTTVCYSKPYITIHVHRRYIIILLHISVVFSEEVKHINNHIRQLYTKSSYLMDDESWPPFTPNKFVSLLLIHHLEKVLNKEVTTIASNLKTSHLKVNEEQSFTTNDISEIFQCGTNIEAHNKKILIIGVPGIGKTILSKEIAYKWANSQLLSEKELVLILFLRDPNIQKIKELKDIIHYFYGFSKDTVGISASCAKFLLQMGGVNVTIILDGLDEISNDIIDNTYIKLLLSRNALPCCRIVITSHPAVSVKLQAKADTEVEIFGFTKENINSFINNELNIDMQNKLKDYLKLNESLYHLCYIPFMLSVLVCIVKEYDELPSNSVEAYKKFIDFTFLRFLKRFEYSHQNISTIEQLPDEYNSYFLELSKYAFNVLEVNQVVFTKKDINKTFPILANAPEKWYGLGLLNAVKYFKVAENSDCVSYNFLHKSIQEFLAAYYISTLSTGKQIILLKKYFYLDGYLNTVNREMFEVK